MRWSETKRIKLFLDDSLEQPELVWKVLDNSIIQVVIPYPVIAVRATRGRMSLKEAQCKGIILNHGYNHDGFARMSALGQIIDVIKASRWLKKHGIKTHKIFVAPQSSIKNLAAVVLNLLFYKIYVGQTRKFLCTSRFPLYQRFLNNTNDIVIRLKQGYIDYYTHDIGLNHSEFGCTKNAIESFIKAVEDYESIHI